MDERFRGKRFWIGAGALAIILLCVMLCGLGAFTMLAMQSGPAHGTVPYVQAPSVEEGSGPPAIQHYSPDPIGRLGYASPFGFVLGAVGALFKLAFFGLLLLVGLGLVKRLFWGPRHWGYRHWGPHYPGKPPEGKEWKAGHRDVWGPWAWHCHGGPWRSEDELADEGSGPDETESAYKGPQE
jgi:hypothetical protein